MPQDPATSPFAFVSIINFELTYSCNLSCSHCLQEALRQSGHNSWLPADVVVRTMQEAQRLGLTALGVNFTGGEVFVEGSPILELLQAAREAGIPTRVNTNACWGGRTRIRIGSIEFKDDEDLVKALRGLDLSVLALSLDNRYDQYPGLLDSAVRAASICEDLQQPYQVIATDPSPEIERNALNKLIYEQGVDPRYLNIVSMDIVDLGAKAFNNQGCLDAEGLAELARRSDCRGKGFYRPTMLHISPDGKVRSCMYAPDGGWLGNIFEGSLADILNKVPDNPVYQLFKSKDLESFTAEFITPWESLYREIHHGCTACALIARAREEISRQEILLGRKLTGIEMEALHRGIAEDYCLNAMV